MGPSVAVGKVGWRRGDFQRWKRLVHVCVIESREEVKIQDERDHCRVTSLSSMGRMLPRSGALGKKGPFCACLGGEGTLGRDAGGWAGRRLEQCSSDCFCFLRASAETEAAEELAKRV